MTPTQTATARTLATLPGFAWEAGMRWVLMNPGPEGWLFGVCVPDNDLPIGGIGNRWAGEQDVPDLTHDGCGGIIFTALGPGWKAWNSTEGGWVVCNYANRGKIIEGSTLAEASALAHIARGRYGVAP